MMLVLIVVFGEPANASPAYNSLALLRNQGFPIGVIVWDNSPTPFCQFPHHSYAEDLYIWTPQNNGLAFIYNQVREKYLSNSDYILLLDQDSVLPFNFFKIWYEAVKKFPDLDLFLPLVKDSGKLVSPLTFFYGWGSYWKSPKIGILDSDRCMALNSGMIIKSDYFKSVFEGYDERLSFYGTDTQFMFNYSQKRGELCIFDSTINHNLSFFRAPNSVKAEKFLQIRMASFYIYEKSPTLTRCLVLLIMIFISFYYAIRFKSLKILFGRAWKS
jgi:hypothetical protein